MGLQAEALKKCILKQGVHRVYWVAYSGGLDSHVLLHLLAGLQKKLDLRISVIHINHQLSSNASSWAAHCARVASAFSLPYIERSITLSAATMQSPEEIARDYRYAIFKEFIKEDDILLTAHHQDDQAETVLLQLLRGAGPKGLAAMPEEKPFGAGKHVRPLLHFTRDELHEYAVVHQLEWINDESNTNTHFTRNFFRHDILPLLKKRWPNVTNTIARSAQNCQETQQLLDEVLQEELHSLQGTRTGTLSVSRLTECSPVRQRYLLRTWIAQSGHVVPSAIKLQQMQHDLLTARADKSPCLRWGKMALRRYRDDIYLLPDIEPSTLPETIDWQLSEPLIIPQVGVLHAVLSQQLGMLLRPDIQKVTVRFRQGGEKLLLSGRTHHHSLKHFFQENHVPPWERSRVPLIYVGEELAGAVGYFICDAFLARNGLGMDLKLL